MKTINISSDGVIEYYGNRAGFVKNNTATVDEIFRKEDLESYLNAQKDLRVVWKSGVYDMLVKGVIEDSVTLKMCRIYQLKPDVDMRMKFIGYDELEKRGFGKPDISNYRVVYDGNIGTNDLEEIYTILNQDDRPEGFTGYSLSVSDIIELYDEDGSEFQYVDKIGFVEVDREPVVQIQTQASENEPVFEDVPDMRESMPYEPKESVQDNTEALDEQNEPRYDGPDDDFHVETFKITM